MASPSDRTFSIIRETTPGTLPGSGSLIPVDYIPGTAPVFVADSLTSPTLGLVRASQGSRRVNFRTEGGLRTQLQRSAAMDLMLESALGGTFTSNILRAGATDTYFSVEQRLIEGSGSLYQRFLGCQVSGFTLNARYDGIVEVGFDILGMTRQTATSPSSLTYASPSSAAKLTGLDVSEVSIENLTAPSDFFVSLSLSCRHTKEAMSGFGSAAARGIGTSGPRSVTLAIQFYRANFNPEAVIGDSPLSVSFRVTGPSADDGYLFELPRAFGTVPQDVDEGAKSLVSVEFTASYHVPSTSDFLITRVS